MRTSKLIFPVILAAAGLVAGASCAVTPPVTVIHGTPPAPIKGDPIKFKRGAQDPYVGADPGFYVVRTRKDWLRVWAGAKEVPALPGNIDLERQMVLLGTAEDKKSTQLQFVRVAEDAELVYVFVKETKAGANCTPKNEHAPYDAVVASRVDKPVKFYVEDDVAQGCGDPPLATLQCRLGEAKEWTQKITAQPGDKVECELTGETRGTFAIVDRILSFAEVPGGSAAKVAYTRGSARGNFDVDVFGTYTIRGEATDEAGRKGIANATIEVVPPRTKDAIVQLIWTNFDPQDDPATFPRTRLHNIDGAIDCSSDKDNPPTCAVKRHSVYTHMTIKASDKKLPLSVDYVDERVEKGPLACVQVYFDGARTGETCDRSHRAAGDKWEVGTLEMATGKIGPVEYADAGVEDAGKDGAAKKPATPTKPAPKPAAPAPKPAAPAPAKDGGK